MNDANPTQSMGRQIVQGYGGGGFRIGGSIHSGSLIILPERRLPWAVCSYENLSVASFNDVVADYRLIEVLLIGCGPNMGMPRSDVRDLLKDHGIVAEWMDTGAACRTFNVLLSENRAVSAALIAVD
jgi:uncharacterized protein